jgi:tetratricopeptide (TPR) repeat protein
MVKEKTKGMNLILSPRQEALRLIYESSGISDLWKLMAKQATLRDCGLADELALQAKELQQYDPLHANILQEMANALRETHASIHRLQDVTDVSSFVQELKYAPFLWDPAFCSLILFVKDDLEASGGSEIAQKIKRAIEIRDDILEQMNNFTTEITQPSKEDNGEKLLSLLDRYPIMRTPESEMLFSLRAEQAKDREKAFFLLVREKLVYLKKFAIAIEKYEQDRKMGKGERIHIEIPLPPTSEFQSSAELMRDFKRNFPKIVEVAEAFIDGSFSWQEAINQMEVVCEKLVPSLSGNLRVDASIRLGRLVLVGGGNPKSVVDIVHEALKTPLNAERFKGRSQAIALFEISQMLIQVAPLLPEVHRTLLFEAIELMNKALESVQSEDLPRFKINALLERGNAFDQLGAWDPKYLDKAEEDYRAALEIPGTSLERVPRGTSLSNLANTIQKQTHRRIAQVQEEALVLLNEAIQILEGTGHLLLGNALLGRAIIFNERHLGDPKENQEHALHDVTQSIQYYEECDASTVHRASALLAKANILRLRLIGSLEENLHEAEIVLHEAIKIIPRTHKDLYARIRSALAQTLIEIYSINKDVGRLEGAIRSLEEAKDFAVTYPMTFAHICDNLGDAYRLISIDGGCDLWIEADDCLAKAYKIYIDMGAEIDLAFCLHRQAILYLSQPRTDLTVISEKILNSLERAFELFNRHGALECCLNVAVTSIRLLTILRMAPENSHKFLTRLKDLLRNALFVLENLWESNEELSWRVGLTSYNELGVGAALCEILLNGSRTTAWSLVSNSKARQMQSEMVLAGLFQSCPDHLKNRLLYLRGQFMKFQRESWIRDRNIYSTNLSDEEPILPSGVRLELGQLTQKVKAVYGIKERYRNYGQITDMLAKEPNTTVLDLSLCKSGGVAIIAATDEKMQLITLEAIPLNLSGPSLINELLNGSLGERRKSFVDSYEKYRIAPEYLKGPLFRELADTTDYILGFLSSNVIEPIWPELSPHLGRSRTLLLILGEGLNSLPLHAAPIPGEDLFTGNRLIDTVKTVAYVPTALMLAGLSNSQRLSGTALLVLSDPSATLEGLTGAPAEIASIAKSLLATGLPVTLLAGKGDKIGRKVFEAFNIELPEKIELPDVAPTPQEVLIRLKTACIFVYSGHATSYQFSKDRNGLVLTNITASHPSYLTLDDIFSADPFQQKPLVILSACETAFSGSLDVGAEYLNIAGGFLRLGASAVCCSLMTVLASDAEVFSKKLAEQLASGNPFIYAYSEAIHKLREKLKRDTPIVQGVRSDHPLRWGPFVSILGVA